MKICIAQTASVIGDIPANISKHKDLIAHAASSKADLIIFPELSLCGYAPELAVANAMQIKDRRLDDFQQLSDENHLTIGLGVPLKQGDGVAIAMLIFQPGASREVYAKKYLHEDEEPYFVSGQSTLNALGVKSEIALAICYELSVPEHAQQACQKETTIYLSSVAKTTSGVKKASARLSAIAEEFGITTMMANCIGPCEGQKGGGKTSVWNSKGKLLLQLNDQEEGFIVLDTNTALASEFYLH